MMTRKWLDTFLGRRELVEPDERLLGEYHCGDDEYRSLIDVLERTGEPERLRQTYRFGVRLEEQELGAEDEDLTMSAFVLYASEWFSREWGGETKRVWKRMMNGVAWSADEYWELYPAMATGLAWWNHSFVWIIKTQYLGTFAYQSGKIRVTGLRN